MNQPDAPSGAVIVDNGCSCPKCAGACGFAPGLMMAEEAAGLLRLGRGRQLMLEWWDDDGGPYSLKNFKFLRIVEGRPRRFYFLCPAIQGREGAKAPDSYNNNVSFRIAVTRRGKGACTFFSDGLCTVHDSGFKPAECRYSFGCRMDIDSRAWRAWVHQGVALSWDRREAQSLVDAWCEQHDLAIEAISSAPTHRGPG